MAKMAHQTPPGFKRVPGKRVTYSPQATTRAIHQRFLRQAEASPLYFPDPGQEVANHLRQGHRYFFSTDLESAFDQVTAQRLRQALVWREIKLGWLVPRQYFFHEKGLGGLIQGAPSSPYLFETYCRFGGLDRSLSEYCGKLGFYYSRYVDDILISSPRELGRRIGPKVREMVGMYGFTLNDRKTKRVDVHSEPLEVLGLVIRGNRIDPSDDVIQKLHEPDRDDASRKGLLNWRRHVRKLSKRARK
jgi:hypothetical protein